ncbi:MAG TPA: ABC transporter permease [Bryobacteraceae bacterium]|nr:ABC transporter permease [Bryobacteraceae bacterium]
MVAPAAAETRPREEAAGAIGRINAFWLPAATLWQRELVRFWRQKSRVLGVVASPLVFWLLIGYGSGNLAQFFPGALVLTVLFSAIFSTISIIEDRREGFLLSMLVSPASRTSLVLGKILGAATLAWLQGLIFLAFAPLARIPLTLESVLALAGVVFLVSFTLTGLGFVIAWKMNSSQGFHAIMNLLLVPMWMVSGSLFPMSTAHGWVRALMWVNPLTYSIAAMNHLMGLERLTGGPGLWPSLAVTIGFGLALLVASGLLAAQKSERSSA